jgi:FtsP/CotA-like multicopper oxidase with cupredoxin domain
MPIDSSRYHEPLPQAINTAMHDRKQQPPPSDNLLINGKMNYPCENTTALCTPNAGVSKFFFVPGKKYRLRLINSGAALNAKFSIDEHTFTVIAQDFTPLVPYETDLISLANGQRCDIIVEAVGTLGSSYWMRNDLGNGTDIKACNSNNGASKSTRLETSRKL